MRKLFYEKSEALKAIENIRKYDADVDVRERDVDVCTCDEFDDEAYSKVVPCSGTVNGFEVNCSDGETHIFAYWQDGYYWESENISTMSDLAEYINEREDYPSDVEEIVQRKGWNQGRTDDEIAWRTSGENTEEVLWITESGVQAIDRIVG